MVGELPCVEAPSFAPATSIPSWDTATPMFFSHSSGSQPQRPVCKGSDYCMELSMEGGTSLVIFLAIGTIVRVRAGCPSTGELGGL